LLTNERLGGGLQVALNVSLTKVEEHVNAELVGHDDVTAMMKILDELLDEHVVPNADASVFRKDKY
jgi:hypothetical protein